LLKLLIPPIFFIFLNKLRGGKYGWKGNYSSWEDACRHATGYDQNDILSKVKESALKVKNGEAAYERDSVVFDQICYSWPILSGILLSSGKSGSIHVLDFGGGLGSTFYQNKKFLDLFDEVSWSIIEQPNFVKTGQQYFSDNSLRFYPDLESCLKEQQPNVLLLSSVMQYIEKPYELIEQLSKIRFDYILVDRTPFSYEDKEQLKLQVVSPEIYSASYPCWFFSESSFIEHYLKNGYKLIESFASLEGNSRDCMFKGMIFKRD
jgi:putative methyltransferase (TIGR04325 family)